MVIKGTISFEKCQSLISLGKLKKIEGSLDISDCKNLKHLGKLEIVTGELWCESCFELTSLNNLKESLSINAWNCKNLKDLGNLTKIQLLGSFNYCKNLTSLGNLKYVGQNLYLKDCINLKELPKGLKVEGTIFIEGSGITEEYLEKYHPDIYFRKI